MALDLDKVRDWLNNSDGHSILSRDYFFAMGLTDAQLDRLDTTHSSDPNLGSHAAHAADGGPEPFVRGCAEFDAIQVVAMELGIRLQAPYFERGPNWRHQRDQILDAIMRREWDEWKNE